MGLFKKKQKLPLIYFTPFEGFPTGNHFFDFDQKQPYPFWTTLREQLKSQGLALKCVPQKTVPAKEGAVVLFHNMPSPALLKSYQRHYSKEQLILFQWEPPVVDPLGHMAHTHQFFHRIYLLRSDLCDENHYFYFSFPTLNPQKEWVEGQKRRFLTLIAGNKRSFQLGQLYCERRKIIDYFKNRCPNDFDLYGTGWEREELPCYRGSPSDKHATLLRYRFSLCYENCRLAGYITEKIIDCFLAGSIPIYLGAPNIRDFIPEGCFIDRERFTSLDALYDFLQTMPSQVYLNYLEKIRTFLRSESYRRFSLDAFAKTLVEAVSSSLEAQKR